MWIMPFATDRDLQCDFDSPFWSSTDCKWHYNQALMTSLQLGNPGLLFVRTLGPVSDLNYWRSPQATTGLIVFKMKKLWPSYIWQCSSDNYVLGATSAGSYALFSPIQKETGPRLLDQFFGFAYSGTNATIRAVLLKNGTYLLDLTPPGYLRVSGNYCSKPKTPWASTKCKEAHFIFFPDCRQCDCFGLRHRLPRQLW